MFSSLCVLRNHAYPKVTKNQLMFSSRSIMESADKQKLLVLMKSRLLIFFSFMVSAFGILFKKSTYSRDMKLFSMFPSRNHCFLSFTFRSLIHLELILAYDIKQGSSFSFSSSSYRYLTAPASFVGKTTLHTDLQGWLGHKSGDHICVGIFLNLFLLVYQSNLIITWS